MTHCTQVPQQRKSVAPKCRTCSRRCGTLFWTWVYCSAIVKKVWKSVNIRWSYGQEFGVLFFLTHGVVVFSYSNVIYHTSLELSCVDEANKIGCHGDVPWGIEKLISHWLIAYRHRSFKCKNSFMIGLVDVVTAWSDTYIHTYARLTALFPGLPG